MIPSQSPLLSTLACIYPSPCVLRMLQMPQRCLSAPTSHLLALRCIWLLPSARHCLSCQSCCQIQFQSWSGSLASCKACASLFEVHSCPPTSLSTSLPHHLSHLLTQILIMVANQTMGSLLVDLWSKLNLERFPGVPGCSPCLPCPQLS